MSEGDKPAAPSDRPTGAPLSETLPPGVPVQPVNDFDDDPYAETSVVEGATFEDVGSSVPTQHAVAPGEALQLVRYSRRGATLMITGLTPHGRRLTFEQREDRDGWYVVAAGRRRRPTRRELGLVVASITQEMEAAMVPESEREVRSAYMLATTSDQPGVAIRGLQAYRDLLLDEAAAYVGGEIERLAVVAVQYQSFKRFAIRHGHRIGAAFVMALGERLQALFQDDECVAPCHKTGKSFRLIVRDCSSKQVQALVGLVTDQATRDWIVDRVWGSDRRTHPDEVNFYVGIAAARASERDDDDSEALAQRLNDDAFRAAKVGQLLGYDSIAVAKSAYRTTVYQWNRNSDDDLQELASQMDEGPAEVMLEMSDYLHELVPADLEGMAVQGDLQALIHKAIARDGFWQGTTAMRIAGDRLIRRFLDNTCAPPDQLDHVGGFDLGDEFYGIAWEGDALSFCWGDLNSAGATRVRAGLKQIQRAVGWRRVDGGGVVGRFVAALRPGEPGSSLPDRVRRAAAASYTENWADESLRVNDSVDIADYLWAPSGELVRNEDLVEGERLRLVLPWVEEEVEVLERRSRFGLRLQIGGDEHVASLAESSSGPSIKLRVRDAVVSAAVCILQMRRDQLDEALSIVREDNHLAEDAELDVVGFLRHIADILMSDRVKGPAKIELALGAEYSTDRFVQVFNLEYVREHFPGLYYEAVHHSLLNVHPLGVDRHLQELIARTMLGELRPERDSQPCPPGATGPRVAVGPTPGALGPGTLGPTPRALGGPTPGVPRERRSVGRNGSGVDGVEPT